jgi:hypothetical protein
MDGPFLNAERLAAYRRRTRDWGPGWRWTMPSGPWKRPSCAIALAEESIVVAEEDLRVIQLRYELGVATILEVVNSQVALDEQLVNLVTARYDYAVARAQLEALLGRDL